MKARSFRKKTWWYHIKTKWTDGLCKHGASGWGTEEIVAIVPEKEHRSCSSTLEEGRVQRNGQKTKAVLNYLPSILRHYFWARATRVFSPSTGANMSKKREGSNGRAKRGEGPAIDCPDGKIAISKLPLAFLKSPLHAPMCLGLAMKDCRWGPTENGDTNPVVSNWCCNGPSWALMHDQLVVARKKKTFFFKLIAERKLWKCVRLPEYFFFLSLSLWSEGEDGGTVRHSNQCLQQQAAQWCLVAKMLRIKGRRMLLNKNKVRPIYEVKRGGTGKKRYIFRFTFF